MDQKLKTLENELRTLKYLESELMKVVDLLKFLRRDFVVLKKNQGFIKVMNSEWTELDTLLQKLKKSIPTMAEQEQAR